MKNSWGKLFLNKKFLPAIFKKPLREHTVRVNSKRESHLP